MIVIPHKGIIIIETIIGFTSFFIIKFFISGIFRYAFLSIFFKRKKYIKALYILYYSDFLLCIWILEILSIITDKNIIYNIYKNIHIFDIAYIEKLPQKNLNSIKIKRTHFKYIAITYIILAIYNLIKNSTNIFACIFIILLYKINKSKIK